MHWPDNMVTYSAYDKILFSNDMFGQHIASFNRYDDQYDLSVLIDELKKYYVNVILPYGAQTQKALSAVKALDIELICTSHGAILRSYIKEVFEAYDKNEYIS